MSSNGKKEIAGHSVEKNDGRSRDGIIDHTDEQKKIVGHSDEQKEIVGHSYEEKEVVGHSDKQKKIVGHSDELESDGRSIEKKATGHSDEGQDTAGRCEGLVDLYVLPHKGENVSYDEKKNFSTLKRRWPHQSTRPPRFKWSGHQWRQYRQQQQRQQAARGKTSVLPLVCQRSATPPHESSPAGSLPASDVNQVASCPTEEQLLSSSQQPPVSSTEGQIPDGVDEAPINLVLPKVPNSGNEKQCVSNKCPTTDNAEKSSSNMADATSPAFSYQPHGHFTALRSAMPGNRISSSVTNEQSPSSYHWKYSTVPYYQPPYPTYQVQPHHTGIQSLETGEELPNATTDCPASTSVEWVQPDYRMGQQFNPTQQQPSPVWVPPDSFPNEPYTYNQWISDIAKEKALRTAYTAQQLYTFTNRQLYEWNGQQLSVPLQQPITNLGGQQVLWSRSNIQRQMYYPQQVTCSNAALQTNNYLTCYQHRVTPGYHSPTSALVSPFNTICTCSQCQATSFQNPQVLNPVYYTSLPPSNNQVFYNAQWQVGSSSVPVYTLQDPAVFSGTVSQAPSQQRLESYTLETNKERSSSEDTTQVTSSFPSIQAEEMPSESAVETGNHPGREESGEKDLEAGEPMVQENRQTDEQELEAPQNDYRIESENSQEPEGDQHQEEKDARNIMDKKSRKKRYKHRKREQVQNVELEAPPVERQQNIPIWKKWKRNQAQDSMSGYQPQGARSNNGASAWKKSDRGRDRGRGRWQTVQYGVRAMLSSKVAARGQEGPQSSSRPEVIQLGGPTPQHSSKGAPRPEVIQLGGPTLQKSSKATPKPEVIQLGGPTPQQSAKATPKPAVIHLGGPTPQQSSNVTPRPEAIQPSGLTPQQTSKATPKPAVIQLGGPTPQQSSNVTPRPEAIQPGGLTPQQTSKTTPKPAVIQLDGPTPQQSSKATPRPEAIQLGGLTPQQSSKATPRPEAIQLGCLTPQQSSKATPRPQVIQPGGLTPQKTSKATPPRSEAIQPGGPIPQQSSKATPRPEAIQLGCLTLQQSSKDIPRPEVIQLGGPTPQQSARRRRRRLSASHHTDADVDETRLPPRGRCTHCMSTSPPSRVCYRCCFLGASRGVRRADKKSRPRARAQPLQAGAQTGSGEAAAGRSDAGPAAASGERQ